jgi:hypothetical protein
LLGAHEARVNIRFLVQRRDLSRGDRADAGDGEKSPTVTSFADSF